MLIISMVEWWFVCFSVVSSAPSPGSTSDEGSAPSTPRPMSPSNPDRGNILLILPSIITYIYSQPSI